MFFAVLFTAYVTGTLTANLTLQSLRGAIQGPSDLPGKRVATVTGSTSEEYLEENHVRAMPYATVAEAFEALEAGKVQAFVYDAPILAYYANSEGKEHTQLVGSVFRPESYGIALNSNSPWRKRINLTLLQLREDGTYEALRTKYFGDSTN
ncbi:glutamine-binding periplasmic protein [Abditibacteriota bacterium]|nr:glutamine-binding periplasmic protein [Abditibacteriota bacterium]